MTMTDRHGTPLAIGQRLRVQVCVGRYGQTAIRQGIIEELDERLSGVVLRLDAGFTENCGRFGMHYRPTGSSFFVGVERNGFYEHVDFEHAHKVWSEIIPAGD